ncbi:MAG TPA: DMT family transporter [Mycobacteriales bacterium]|nr:DMT family transporter [Mycobacteriales bacterium]
MPADRSRAGVLERPSRVDFALLAIGVAGVSTSAPLIKAAAAPALAVAFWRNALASLILVPYAAARHRAELRGLTRRDVRLCVLAGLLLAAHFATWIPSLSFTSVSSSVALVATQPVWAAVVARLRGEVVTQRAWAGIALAVLGAVLLSGIDLTISARALFGDVLALVGGVFAAMYVTVGAEVRRTLSTTAYTTICYVVAAVVLLVTCLGSTQPMAGYGASTWWRIVALTVLAQLLGHSVFNRVLKTTSPTVVSIAILFEIVGAAVLAALFIGERPPLVALPAAALIAVGVVVVVRSGSRPEVAGTPVVE